MEGARGREMSPEFAAYKDELRRVALSMRLAGLLTLLFGCALLVASRYLAQPWMNLPGFVFLGLGWGVTGYAIWRRTQWAKAHPFEGPR